VMSEYLNKSQVASVRTALTGAATFQRSDMTVERIPRGIVKCLAYRSIDP
jgi:hypothetical protein